MQGDCSTVSTPSEGAEGLIDGNQRIRHGRTSGPARRSTRGQWTAEEDEILIKAVQRFKGKNWKKIAECFKDRTDVQCLHRWQKVLNPELVKGPWTKEEDEMIIELVNKYGPKKWSTIARYLPGRIGKQCRERWHNHLNPAINKEAWTQEEELILIRAHQIYGNRWAELTKFLPGRTDNGIKNHWHSSVKKKLDSYLTSGLLDQYQTLPLVPFQNSSMPSSSVDMQTIEDENGYIGGVSEKELECSQNSSIVGCSVSTGGLTNGVINTGQHFHPSEIPYENEQTTVAAYHQDQYYYPTMDDITITISDTSEMEDSSKFPDQDLSQDVVTSSSQDCHRGLQSLPNIASLGLRDESSWLPSCTNKSNHQVTNTSVWTSNSFKVPTSIPSMEGTTYNSAANILISDVECCKVLFPGEENKGQCASGTLIQEPKEAEQAKCQDSLPYPSSSDFQMSESVRTSASQSCPSRLNTTAAPCKEALRPAPLIISSDKHAKESAQLICHPFEAETKCFANANDSFICIDDPVDSPSNGDGTANSSQKGRSFHVNDSKKLVPVNDFASQPDFQPGSSTNKGEPDANSEQTEDAGALCHEPLRFPRLDVPFFSCDLMQSKNDFLHDYSPLGLRKLLMSTMTCMSPLRLWGSPTQDQSPLLKSGTKTSFGAPSILKKRHRDLLSPLSERRSDKKLETDITANLAKDFSRLDFMFDESGISSGASLEEKENQSHPFNGEHEENGKSNASLISSNKVPEETLNSSNPLDKAEKECLKTNAKEKDDREPARPNDENLSGVLAECNTNNSFLFSPNQSFSKTDKALVSSTQTPRNQLQRTLVATSNKEHSPASLCLIINSPSHTRNTEGHLLDNSTSSVGNENLSIFCGTPFRNLESPSAWKSPLVINSFWSSPRFDPELTIEDMGYISPGDRSYNAIGFVEQINEHTAATGVTDPTDVPGSDASETASKQKQTNVDKENTAVPAECRVLDFNDCDSPTKHNYNIKPSTPPIASCSSPSSSSFLLKACR